ncbi:hypothetical protein TVAG_496580 [Trichomonas vaginalis G3]|uniref:Uncharacterized protein n=1 Tax=Trichomonas vaginalis (strain ATCC PRA-98 / G3) TaxID=412133 RepID=A2GXH5_TRIV3|nr:uncharacterized protein TVAGG3_1087340 [Trichomonas vaginalis G3]EAX78143.1 hypothetical protein TVAG_496580 [Trichomonas vaginalis G3]KAI5482361.1 hypothetical protein TVAGG3_1087340 [Trichomonas vaginalis G3]|eukprot:XP_001291073.1 hypothetical protein [Trichomonas vaginalis G3]
MAQVAQLGKLPRQILPTGRTLASDRKSFSRQQEELLHPTGRTLASDRKSFSRQQEELFHQTGKIFLVVRP